MVTFPVDDVEAAGAPLPTVPLSSLVPDALAVGGDPALPVLAADGVHPLLSAVARAFADHRPLVLSPDAVWLTIAGGVAQHIRLHAGELRPRLVRHAGRKRLEVTVAGPMPRDPGSWAELAEVFAKQLAAEAEGAELFECDFSTSTGVERTAARVVLLDAYSPYFSLWLTCICGIPSITLTGTAEDWRRIRARVDAIAELGLSAWCRSLAPIADEFVRAAEGRPDTQFWRRIYNPIDAYGGEMITGWVARLYPYLKGMALDVPNSLLDLLIGEPRDVTAERRGFYAGPGITSSSVPAVLSRVVVNVNDRTAGENRAVALHGGLVAVAQDPGGALRPVAGWHLAPAAIEIDDVLDRLVAAQETTPAGEVADDAPPEVVAVYRRIGSATLFGGGWRLVPAAERRYVECADPELYIATLFELADGRSIASATRFGSEDTQWLAGRVEAMRAHRWRLAADPADVPLLGGSLALLLDAALDSDGDVAHLETGRLADLLGGARSVAEEA